MGAPSATAVVTGIALAACYEPSAAPGAPCGPGAACPTDQECDETAPGGPRCVYAGTSASVDAAIDAAPVAICTVAACPDAFAKVDGGCYRLFGEARPWLAAELDCESRGAHLVVTDTVAEHYTIHGLAAGVQRIWIGWTDRRKQDNVFVWVAPSAGQFLQSNQCVFGPGDPDPNDDTHCAVSLGDNACPDHFDESCALALPYMCECDGHAADPAAY